MSSFGVLDPQLVSSNTTKDKKVKQNTFVLHGDYGLMTQASHKR